MGVLNTAPGLLIRGENMGLCTGLYAAYKALAETKATHGRSVNNSSFAFYGADKLDEHAFLEDARHLLKHQLVPAEDVGVKCWGFKEIRYTPNELRAVEEHELPAFLDFMSRLLPNPGFTFLTRNHEDVANSAWWRTTKKWKVLEELTTLERNAREWSDGRPDCFWLDYEDILARGERLTSLFAFLGAEYDEMCVREVMSREHSYAGHAKHLTNVQRRDARNFEVHHFKPAGVHLVHIDNLPSELHDDMRFEVGGIVLLEPGTDAAGDLSVNGSNTEPVVQTGLPSPKYGRTYPDNPKAANARFLISGVSIKAGETVNVQIDVGADDPATVFSIAL